MSGCYPLCGHHSGPEKGCLLVHMVADEGHVALEVLHRAQQTADALVPGSVYCVHFEGHFFDHRVYVSYTLTRSSAGGQVLAHSLYWVYFACLYLSTP